MRLRRFDGTPSRNLIFIGDSYQKGDNNGGFSFYNYFYNKYRNEFGSLYRAQASGYGFAKTNAKFITLIRGLEGSVGEPDKITDIIVTGGYNDYNNPNGVGEAIAEFMNYCKQTYINAEVWLAPVGWSFKLDTNRRKLQLQAIQNWCREGALKGCLVMPNISTLFRDRTLLTSDNLHPNNTGHEYLAAYMHDCLTKGSCDVVQPNSSVDYANNSGVTVSGDFYSSAHNGIATFYNTERKSVDFSSNKNINGFPDQSSVITFGTVTNSKTWGFAGIDSASAARSNGTTITLTFRNEADNKYRNVDGFIFIRHGKLCFQALGVDSAYNTFNFNTKRGYIPPFQIVVDNFYG